MSNNNYSLKNNKINKKSSKEVHLSIKITYYKENHKFNLKDNLYKERETNLIKMVLYT